MEFAAATVQSCARASSGGCIACPARRLGLPAGLAPVPVGRLSFAGFLCRPLNHYPKNRASRGRPRAARGAPPSERQAPVNRERVVILGCGRQGARLAELLQAENYEVIVIDRNATSFGRLHEFQGERMVGNGIDEDVLRRAGIERAAAFAAVTNGDNTNIMAAQIAKVIFEVPKVVCRVYDPARAGIYHDLGLETVSATTVGARMVRNLIIGPKVLRQYQMGDGTAVAIEVKIPLAVSGTVRDFEMEGECRIGAVVRDQKPMIATPDMEIQGGDHIFAIVLSRSLPDVRDRLQVDQYAVNFPGKAGF